MTWVTAHEESERLASQAEALTRAGDRQSALRMYAMAARLEEEALRDVSEGQPRTTGILAVSAASLWFKAREYAAAESVSYRAMSLSYLPEFARGELRLVVQSSWIEAAKKSAGVAFLPGQVLVSVSGGEIVEGGAPMDLILDKVKGIQSLFFRTIEYMRGVPLRKRGGPSAEIQEACRPWLFQAAPGSYQFSVAVQEPTQPDFFQPHIKPDEIVDRFLKIVGAAASEEPNSLATEVDEPEYQRAFLKLTRNLAPKGRQYSALEIKSADTGSRIALDVGSNVNIEQTLGRMATPVAREIGQTETFKGVLRALHLDNDWLEIAVGSEAKKVEGLQDSMDDVIGPMVNRRVVVKTSRDRRKYRLIDIQLDE